METSLYYLQSRYYDPEIGRFINADDVVSEPGGQILGTNKFAYCFNNPVNLQDETGTWPQWLKTVVTVAAGVTVAAAGVAAVVTAAPVLAAAVSVGFVAGAVYAGGALACGVVATVCGASIAGEAITGKNPVKELVGEDAFAAATIISTAGSAHWLSELPTPQPKQGVAIGEGMDSRVKPFAKANNLDTYKGIKGYKVIKKVFGKTAANNISMSHNQSWINRQINKGIAVYDIGPVGNGSPWYAMEKQAVNGYSKYIKMY